MTGKHSQKLVDQQQALDAFFESLMHDVEAVAEAEASSAPPVAETPKPAARPTLVSPLPPPVKLDTVSEPSIFESLPSVAPPVEAPIIAEPVVESPVIETEITEQLVAEPAPEAPAPSDDPAWLGQQVQAMLFKVAGLTLAVPLVDLNGVVEWDEEQITAMPGHADFYMGLMTHLNRQIPVVDTAHLVLPESRRVQLAGTDARARIKRVVLINNSQYGLACDEVNEVVTLKADAVRWRSQRTKRRWLAGTVIEHMCALVDATAFADLLASRAPVDAFRE